METQQIMSDYTGWQTGGSVEDYNQMPEFVLPEEDTYILRLDSMGEPEDVDPKYNKTGKEKKRASFTFVIEDDEDFGGTTVRQYYTISLNEKSKLLPVVEALVGRKLQATDRVGWEDSTWTGPAGEVYEVVGIGGKRMKATIKHKQREDGRVFPEIVGPTKVRSRAAKSVDPANLEPEPDDVPF